MLPFPETQQWKNFIDSIHSEATKRQYAVRLLKFMEHHKLTDPKELIEPSRAIREQRMVDFIVASRNKISHSTISGYIAALWHFYYYNDVTDVNWVKVRGYIGNHKKLTKDKAYTVEQVRKLVTTADLRFKVIILLLASTGIRIGALTGIKIGDLSTPDKFPSIYKISIYSGEPEEYFTYCTPECRIHIDQYLEERKRAGETIKPESPLIREQYDKQDAATPRKLSTATVTNLMADLAVRTGLRETSNNQHQRHNTMLNHGFRKFFFKQVGKSGVDPVVREFLMGHKTGNPTIGVTNLMMIYDATEDNDALKGYIQAIDNLTIFTENKLLMEKEELEKKLIGEEAIRAQLADLNAKYDQMLKKR